MGWKHMITYTKVMPKDPVVLNTDSWLNLENTVKEILVIILAVIYGYTWPQTLEISCSSMLFKNQII